MSSQAARLDPASIAYDFGEGLIALAPQLPPISTTPGPVGVNPIQPPFFTMPTIQQVGISSPLDNPEYRYASAMQRETQELLQSFDTPTQPAPKAKKKGGGLKLFGFILLGMATGLVIGGGK